jgi:hypothetical protein
MSVCVKCVKCARFLSIFRRKALHLRFPGGLRYAVYVFVCICSLCKCAVCVNLYHAMGDERRITVAEKTWHTCVPQAPALHLVVIAPPAPPHEQDPQRWPPGNHIKGAH